MMHAAAFSGKKELVQLAYDLGLDINARYGKDGVTPVDVGEDAECHAFHAISRRKKRMGTWQNSSQIKDKYLNFLLTA